jgi:hypothetical protein
VLLCMIRRDLVAYYTVPRRQPDSITAD